MADATPKLRDSEEEPLSEKERWNIRRMTSDPLSFHEDFIHWLEVKYKDEFDVLPHGAQQYATVDWVNDSDPDSDQIIAFDTVEHDTNVYVFEGLFVVPPKLGGVYTLCVTVKYDDPGDDCMLSIYNGDVCIAKTDVSGDFGALSVTRHLAQGDVLTARSSTSTSQTILAAGEPVAMFNIALIYLLDAAVTPTGGGGEDCNPPVNVTPPVVTPAPTYNSFTDDLHSDAGGWSGDFVITFTYQWQWQTNDDGIWHDYGPEGQTNTVLNADIHNGHIARHRCIVTATNDCDSATATSNSTLEEAE